MALLSFKAEGSEFQRYLVRLEMLLDGVPIPHDDWGNVQKKIPEKYRTFYQAILKGKMRLLHGVYVLDIEPILPKFHLIPSTLFIVGFLLSGSVLLMILGLLFLFPEAFYQENLYKIILKYAAKKRAGKVHFVFHQDALKAILYGAK